MSQKTGSHLHEGTIGIPVSGTKESKIAHYWVKAYE